VVTDRGQAHTLEASVAALLLLVSIGIALQMTAVTPLSASTSSQHLENQLEESAKGVLASSAESGDLKTALLYWNSNASKFHNADTEYYYTNNKSEHSLGQTLNRTLDQRNVAYNVYVVFETSDNEQRRRRMIYSGEPSEHAVTASHTVTLLSNDNLIDADGTTNSTTIGETSAYYIPNSTGTPGVYNHVRVEVVAWRI
jgi:hypothetical protein